MAEGLIRSWLRPHRVVMFVLFVSALGLGYVILPGYKARIAMLERDGKHREALRILEDRFVAGDRRQHTLYELEGLYELFGDLPKSRQMLETLAEERPNDAAIQKKLAQFYKQTQNERSYLKALTAQIDIKYSESACKELIGMYRLSGAFADEQAAIQKCRQKGYRRPEDLVRLAGLEASDGDLKEASTLMRGVDDLKRLKTLRERFQLFAILLETEQPNEARRRAVRWSKTTKDEALVLSLIEMLAREQRFDEAIELAKDVGVVGDSVSLTVAEMMLDRGQPLAAKAFLRGWIEKARAGTDSTIPIRFILAALDAEDAGNAIAGARRLGFENVSEDEFRLLAEALKSSGHADDVESMRAALQWAAKRETVQTVPETIPGTTAGPGGASPSTARITPDPRLGAWRTALWSRLAVENAPPPSPTPDPKAGGNTDSSKVSPPIAVAATLKDPGPRDSIASPSDTHKLTKGARLLHHLRKSRRARAAAQASTAAATTGPVTQKKSVFGLPSAKPPPGE